MCDIRQDSSSKIKALFYYLEAHFQRSERVNNDTLLCDLSQSDDKIDRNVAALENPKLKCIGARNPILI